MNDFFNGKSFRGNDILKILKEARIKESLGIITSFKEKYEYLEGLRGAIIRAKNFEYEGPQNDGIDHEFEVDIALKSIEFEMDYLKKLLKFDEVGEVQKMGKIKWKGSTALFGYLFLELIKYGYIEPPLRNGETNYSAFARLCYQYFEVSNKRGELTTLENLEKELNPNKCSLSDTKRAKFTIPDLSDLA